MPGENQMGTIPPEGPRANSMPNMDLPPMPEIKPPVAPELKMGTEEKPIKPDFTGEKMANMKLPNYDNVSGDSIDKYNRLTIPAPTGVKAKYDFSLPKIDVPKPSEAPEEFEIKSDFDKYTDNEILDKVREDYANTTQYEGPIFVNVDDYKRALDGLDYIRGKLSESDDILIKTEEIDDFKKAQFEIGNEI